MISDKEKNLRIVDKINSSWSAIETITKNANGSKYHIVINKRGNRSVSIVSYGNDYKEAVKEYNKFERTQIYTDVTLVSAGPIKILRQAYPNLFFDLTEFQTHLKEIIKMSNNQTS